MDKKKIFLISLISIAVPIVILFVIGFYQEPWFYALTFIISIDILFIYYLLLKQEEEEKIIERNK